MWPPRPSCSELSSVPFATELSLATPLRRRARHAVPLPRAHSLPLRGQWERSLHPRRHCARRQRSARICARAAARERMRCDIGGGRVQASTARTSRAACLREISVRHRLCLVSPLPSWLRHRLCLEFPLPLWLRHRLCLVSPLPWWLRHHLCLVSPLPLWLVAETPPLPCVRIAFVANTPPVPCGPADICNGRFGVTPDSNGEEVYYYVVTHEAPFTAGCFGGAHGVATLEECRSLYSDCEPLTALLCTSLHRCQGSTVDLRSAHHKIPRTPHRTHRTHSEHAPQNTTHTTHTAHTENTHTHIAHAPHHMHAQRYASCRESTRL